MSDVYRAATTHTVEWDEKTHTYWEYEKVVLATDYDALLAVLRQCVGLVAKWEHTDAAGGGCPGCQGRTGDLRSALAAARAVLEGER